MKSQIKLYLLGLVFCLAACGGAENMQEGMDMKTSEEIYKNEVEPITEDDIPPQDVKTKEPVNTSGEGEKKVVPLKQKPEEPAHKALKIIKTANLRFEVEDMGKSLKKIKKAFRKYDAYIASASQQRNTGFLSNDLVMRVEVGAFEDLLDDLLEESIHLDQNDIEAQDVTATFVDIKARLKTKKKVEERYISILNQAVSIDEILKVEDEIRQIREEIEAQEGRLKYLRDQTRYSTISVEIYQNIKQEPVPVVAESRYNFFDEMGDALAVGWMGILSFLVGIAHIWPLLVIGGVTGYFIYRYWKKNNPAQIRKEDV